MTTPALIGRDPDQSRRTLRFMDEVRARFNQMALDGTLFQVGSQSWGLIGLLYTGNGTPNPLVGYTGDYYLDLSAGVLYKKE